jgi:hypothetical protein
VLAPRGGVAEPGHRACTAAGPRAAPVATGSAHRPFLTAGGHRARLRPPDSRHHSDQTTADLKKLSRADNLPAVHDEQAQRRSITRVGHVGEAAEPGPGRPLAWRPNRHRHPAARAALCPPPAALRHLRPSSAASPEHSGPPAPLSRSPGPPTQTMRPPPSAVRVRPCRRFPLESPMRTFGAPNRSGRGSCRSCAPGSQRDANQVLPRTCRGGRCAPLPGRRSL